MAHFVFLVIQNTSPGANTHFLKKTRHHFLLWSAVKVPKHYLFLPSRWEGVSEANDHCVTVSGYVWMKHSIMHSRVISDIPH